MMMRCILHLKNDAKNFERRMGAMESKKNVFELLSEYAAQENATKTENEQMYTAYKNLSDTTQGECCCASLGALCCCGL